MCNTRAFRYSCGHFNCRHLSSCRGTYADPKGAVVLCNGSPNLTVTVDELCSTCQYKKFREQWENRLAEAQEKRLVAMQMMREFEDDGASCCDDIDGPTGLVGTGGDGMSDFFGDASVALKERQKADAELTRLKDEYEHEVMTKWSAFLKGGQKQSMAAKLRRLRRPAPKNPGSSPLKNEKGFAEIAMEAQAEEEKNGRRSSMGMSRSPSLTSDSSDDSMDSNEDDELYQPPASSLPPSTWTLPDATGFEKGVEMDLGLGIKERTVETAIADDDEEPMLPNYGF